MVTCELPGRPVLEGIKSIFLITMKYIYMSIDIEGLKLQRALETDTVYIFGIRRKCVLLLLLLFSSH